VYFGITLYGATELL